MPNEDPVTPTDIVQSFGYGITDGLKDFFVQPVVGAKKEGGIGFVKGLGKGLGNIICKPAAGKKHSRWPSAISLLTGCRCRGSGLIQFCWCVQRNPSTQAKRL